MKVFLKKTVPRLGKAGEKVLVKNGYARNFLIPQNIAVAVKDSNLKILERQKVVIFEEKRIATEKAIDIASKLKGVLLEFPLKANPSGKLFGSITSKNIVNKLLGLDIRLDKKCLDLPTPLKEVGQYSIDAKLTDEIVEKIRIVLTIEKEEEASPIKKTVETKIEPIETEPVETETAETKIEPIETEPVETETAETKIEPIETDPVETKTTKKNKPTKKAAAKKK